MAVKFRDFKVKMKTLSRPELLAQVGELSDKITKARLEMAVRKVKNLRSVFHMRKQLAVVKSLLNTQ